jgi:hypothetical protein
VQGRSGDEGDALIGVEQDAGGGPAVEDANDLLAGAADDPGGGVPEGPAQRFGFGGTEGSGQAELLEPADQAALASKSQKGNRLAAESFRRRMLSSTWAWARM